MFSLPQPPPSDPDAPDAAPLYDVYEVWYGAGCISRLLHAADCTREVAEREAEDLRGVWGDCEGVTAVVEPAASGKEFRQ